ncbi:MAG: hypothetical protein WA705_27345 [Candidatus Ozemobacteraceae bacterium]
MGFERTFFTCFPRRFFWLCGPAVLICCCLGGNTVNAQTVKTLDIRWLLLAHPTFQKFSPVFMRFSGTPSEPVLNGEAGLKSLTKEAAAIQKERKGLENRLSAKLREINTEAERKKIEESFLNEQATLNDRAALVERRVRETQEVPGRPGLTTSISIVPEVETLANSVRQVILRMQNGFPGIIADVSDLMPSPDVLPDTRILFENRHFGFWRTSGDNTPQDLEWVRQAREYVARESGEFLPFPYGAIDGRQEAMTKSTAAPSPSSTAAGAGAGIGIVHSRLLLLLHTAMARLDSASGFFFRDAERMNPEALQTALDVANKASHALAQPFEERLRAYFAQRMDLMLQMQNEGNSPASASSVVNNSRKAAIDRQLLENQASITQTEREIRNAREQALSKVFLTSAEADRYLSTTGKNIQAAIQQTAQEAGIRQVLDDSLGIRSFTLPGDTSVIPSFVGTTDLFSQRLFHAFLSWPKSISSTIPPDIQKKYLCASLGTEISKSNFRLIEQNSLLAWGAAQFTSGRIFLRGARDVTSDVARRLFASYAIPGNLQTSYMLFLRNFLSTGAPNVAP